MTLGVRILLLEARDILIETAICMVFCKVLTPSAVAEPTRGRQRSPGKKEGPSSSRGPPRGKTVCLIWAGKGGSPKTQPDWLPGDKALLMREGVREGARRNNSETSKSSKGAKCGGVLGLGDEAAAGELEGKMSIEERKVMKTMMWENTKGFFFLFLKTNVILDHLVHLFIFED